MNIIEPIFAQSKNKPSELALCAPGADLSLISYGRLQRSVDNICHRIIAVGIAPGSRVGVVIDDPIFHALMVIALTRLGIVTVSGRGRTVSWPIKLDGIIADRPYQSAAGETLVAEPAWTAGDNRPLEEKYLHCAAADDLCRIFLTARDGKQSAIAMTHGMITTRLDRQKLFFGPRAAFCDRTYLDLRLTTPLGFQVLLGTLWRGGALVMTWDVRKTVVALPTYNVQNVIATPQSLIKLTETIETSASYRTGLEAVFAAGDFKSHDLSDRVRARLCSNLTVGYVSADATMVAAVPAQITARIPGAVGYILPGVQVEIADEKGRALPRGQEGNIRIRSDHGVTECLEDADETRRAFRDGWFYAGDRGFFTKDDILVISSRPGNVHNGEIENSAEQVEDVLSKHASIVECAVVAVPNEFGRQDLCAVVVPRSYLDIDALRALCKTSLPPELVPSQFVAFSVLPKSEHGALDRASLVELVKRALN